MITKTMEMASSHLPAKDLELMASAGNLLQCASTGMGLFVPVPKTEIYEEVCSHIRELGMSEALVELFEFAKGKGVTLIWFDKSHEAHPGLPEYDVT